ncbi:hypothetical protein ACFQ15_00600 [Sphingomonas hankookensis]|uniref:hypothetical protein n=1 Tax=Sphingomonas hankookensis TaxID=563996 RepID=UPI001F5891F4|nr:hypothetical protein [Sphingomonas hankookensis]
MSVAECEGFDTSIMRHLDGAHVVVLLDDGRLEVFHGLDLAIEEGREEALPEVNDGPRASELRYYCIVRPRATPEPDVWIGSGAVVTIIGMALGGATVTMAGRGMYDQIGDGAFQIEFETSPAMTTWRALWSPDAE